MAESKRAASQGLRLLSATSSQADDHWSSSYLDSVWGLESHPHINTAQARWSAQEEEDVRYLPHHRASSRPARTTIASKANKQTKHTQAWLLKYTHSLTTLSRFPVTVLCRRRPATQADDAQSRQAGTSL